MSETTRIFGVAENVKFAVLLPPAFPAPISPQLVFVLFCLRFASNIHECMLGRLSFVFPRRAAAFWAEKNLIGFGERPHRFFQMGSSAKNQNKELCDMLNREF
jgi:hypothetical protein